MKRPSIQFYPGDWLAALELRAVSLAARGLWIEMICLMKQGHEIGFLTYRDGRPISVEQLARMVGDTPAKVQALLSELESAGVPGKDENGAYFSRRMVRDEAKYQVFKAGQAEAGTRGAAARWAKPHPKAKAPNGVAHPDPKNVSKGKNASSSSSSSSSSSRDQERTPLTPLAGGLNARASTRKPSKVEHEWASKVLATSRDGCPHEPKCETRAKCIGRLVAFQRQQTLEGMHEGLAEGPSSSSARLAGQGVTPERSSVPSASDTDVLIREITAGRES